MTKKLCIPPLEIFKKYWSPIFGVISGNGEWFESADLIIRCWSCRLEKLLPADRIIRYHEDGFDKYCMELDWYIHNLLIKFCKKYSKKAVLERNLRVVKEKKNV